MNFKFTRNERLSGRKSIEELYAQGRSFSLGALRVVWMEDEGNQLSPARVMFSAPKKKFKKAVTRNRLKRLMREAYRKNKNDWYQFLDEKNKKIRLSVVFTADAKITYAEIEAKIILALQRLMKEINLQSKETL